MTKRLIFLFSCLLAFFAVQAHASVFSASGGSSLQTLFSDLGYDYINVADYQTDLNFKLQGMMELQLLSRSNSFTNPMSFGVLESRQRWWGTDYRHHEMFGERAGAGTSASFSMDGAMSSYGFFISKSDPRRWWWRTRYYSYSPFNHYGAVQALFYQDPINSNSYLVAWEGLHIRDPRSDRSYDDLVVRMTIHPAPEPATWVLLATGLLGVWVFASAKRKRNEV
jgi:hypothetical protein